MSDLITGYHGLLLGVDHDRSRAPETLLLHGFTGTAADWSGWPGPAPALAIDLPGHGGSAAPSGDFGAEVARLLAALPGSIRRLVGYSLGGRIALALLAAAPQRFCAATIISAHPGLPDAAARAVRRLADQQWIALLAADGIDGFVSAWEAQPLFASQARLPTAVLNAQRARRRAQSATGLARALAVFGLAEQPDLRPAIAAYPGDLQWIVGADDARFVAVAAGIAALRPATAVHALADCGHNPLLEAPAPLWRLLAGTVGVSCEGSVGIDDQRFR